MRQRFGMGWMEGFKCTRNVGVTCETKIRHGLGGKDVPGKLE